MAEPKKVWTILDASFLCHRLFHGMPALEADGVQISVVYGFLRSLSEFQDQLRTKRLVFCFDSSVSKRRRYYSNYKSARAKRHADATDEEKEARTELTRQMKTLCEKVLPGAGFMNVFRQKGYEADDLIASICDNLPEDEAAVIVSTDADLYQCLSSSVCMFNPITKRMFTAEALRLKHKVDPGDWSLVKAIAGCSTDSIEGVRGVGEVKASQFVNGTLKEGTKARLAISEAFDNGLIDRNLILTTLPLSGVKSMTLREDQVTVKKWKSTIEGLGIRAIREKAPI